MIGIESIVARQPVTFDIELLQAGKVKRQLTSQLFDFCSFVLNLFEEKPLKPSHK